METSPRPTDVTLRMKCPSCSSGLSLLAGRNQLTFHCKHGHTYPMRQLFQSQAQDIHRGLRAVLEIWEEKATALRKVVERALRDGRAELAENFQREARQLDLRIQHLREHLKTVAGDAANGSSAAG